MSGRACGAEIVCPYTTQIQGEPFEEYLQPDMETVISCNRSVEEKHQLDRLYKAEGNCFTPNKKRYFFFLM